MDKLSQRLRQARDTASLTQKELSEKTGISLRSIRSYEKESSTITVHKVQIIAAACDVDEVWLLTGQENNFQQIKAASNGDVIHYENPIEAKHMKLVKEFKNKKLALEVNQKLVRLESLSDGLFKKADDEVDKLIESAEIIIDEKISKQQGRVVGKQRKVKKA